MKNSGHRSIQLKIDEEAVEAIGMTSTTDQPGTMTVKLSKGDTVTRRDGTKITVTELRSLIRRVLSELHRV